ncbi:beta strand repeat-containing protein [Undibacterium sp. Ji49W]|uniref:beta strand repeat-containing protein n=1 Tax=Undibacterium sp. Ji49W TaxID=3413040 RepID=UPI003BF208E4
MMKFIREVFALLLLVGLTACGGGGGSPGNTNGVALFTTAPGALTIAPGETRTYSIGGGVPSYTATSNSAAATVTVNGTTLTIKGGNGGKATIAVKDGAGISVSIDVTIGSGVDLFTSAPTAGIVVGVGENSTTYTIGGGSLLYTVTSNNTSIATVTQSNNTFAVTGVTGGRTTVSVKDSVGALVDITVVVGSIDPLFTTAASSINVGVGAAATYKVGGGNGPYSVGSSNNAVGTASISGTTLTITGASVGTTTVVVRDASIGTVSISVTVGSTANLFTSAPASLTVGIGTTSPTFSIGGGSQIYTATSGNTQIATVGINGNKFVVTGVTPGTTTVTVKDSLGASVPINVTIGSGATFYSTAPGAVTIAVGGSNTYVLGGGSLPYTATSSNTSVVTTSVSGSNVVINGIIPGSANVVLREAGGSNPITITVTVGSGAVNSLFTTAPASVTIAVAASPTYQIGGGNGPYSATSSNAAIATVSVSGTTLTITGVATGNAIIQVKDASGTPVAIAVSVGSGTAVPLYSSAPVAISLAPGAAPVYIVGGGTAPYLATSSDTRVATAVVAGSSMTITGVAAGIATIRLVDSVGAPILISVTVVTGQNANLSVLPISIVGNLGDTVSISISGGSAPYTTTSSNSSNVAIVSGATLNSAGTVTVTLLNVGRTTNVIVTDAQGGVFTVPVVVNAASATLGLNPVDWSINETNNSIIPLTISGGVAPFQVFTNTPLLATVAGTSPDPLNPLTFNGRTVNVSLGTQGTRCVAADTPVLIQVKDSNNTTVTSTMRILNLAVGGC